MKSLMEMVTGGIFTLIKTHTIGNFLMQARFQSQETIYSDNLIVSETSLALRGQYLCPHQPSEQTKIKISSLAC